MASPFPGMDPYLEAPDRWGGVHNALIVLLGEWLTRQVTPRFFVDIKESVFCLPIDDPGRRFIRPDLIFIEEELVPIGQPELGRISPAHLLKRPRPIEKRAPYLAIRDIGNQRIVTAIHVLSPVNKVVGSAGRDAFVGKREQVMQSPTHWLEIDLLRAGARPIEVEDGGDYYALLHRAGGGDQLEAWFAGLRDPLPTIAVPLVDDLPDVPLDLQAAVMTIYERYSYDIGLDYGQPPPAPPLSAADAAWVAERIATWQRARSADAQPTSA